MNRTRSLALLTAAALTTATVAPAAHAADWMSQVYNPTYVSAETAPGAEARLTLNGSYPAGTTFAVAAAGAGWDLSVDDRGTVTARPLGQYPGAYVQNYVTVTYPDGTVDYAPFTVRVVRPAVSLADSLQLSWGDATVAPGGSVTLRPSVPLPEGTQLAAPAGSGGWRIDADRSSGNVTVTAPAGARAGAGIALTLGAAFPDGSTKQYTSRVIVGQAAATTTAAATTAPTATTKPTTPTQPTTPQPAPGALSYADTPVPAGSQVTVYLNGTLPDGSRVYGPNQKYNGWTLRTDEETGAITYTAPADAKPGYALKLDVTVVFPDGTRRTVPASAHVPAATSTTAQPTTTTTPRRPAAETANVSIDNATIKAGESIVVTPKGLPAGARVFVTEETRGGWTIARDGDTGIRIAAAQGMAPGSVLRINAAILFADGSSANRTFDTTVAPRLDAASLSYPAATVAPGGSVNVTPAGAVPRGTTFQVGQVPDGWRATVNRTTGRVTVRAPRSAGEAVKVPVVASLSDGSTHTYELDMRTTGAATTTTTAPAPAPTPSNPGNPSNPGAIAAGVVAGLALTLGMLGLLGGYIPFF